MAQATTNIETFGTKVSAADVASAFQRAGRDAISDDVAEGIAETVSRLGLTLAIDAAANDFQHGFHALLLDYRAALEEAADPSKRARRLIWRAEELERWADAEASELTYRQDCLQTAIDRQFGADEIASRRATVERLTGTVSAWRAEAALSRAEAVQVMAAAQRVAA